MLWVDKVRPSTTGFLQQHHHHQLAAEQLSSVGRSTARMLSTSLSCTRTSQQT